MALGLKCGGTLEARAERLFSTKARAHRCFYSHSVVLMTAQSLVYILESNCFENLPTFKFIADNSLTFVRFQRIFEIKTSLLSFYHVNAILNLLQSIFLTEHVKFGFFQPSHKYQMLRCKKSQYIDISKFAFTTVRTKNSAI